MGRKKKEVENPLVINPDEVVITQTAPNKSVRSTIQPVSVQSYATPKEPDIYVPPGHVHVVALDEQGQEKPSSGFNIGEADFYKYFNNDRFLLKKKANQ